MAETLNPRVTRLERAMAALAEGQVRMQKAQIRIQKDQAKMQKAQLRMDTPWRTWPKCRPRIKPRPASGKNVLTNVLEN